MYIVTKQTEIGCYILYNIIVSAKAQFLDTNIWHG